jgi:hypothetical protein
MTIRSLTLRLAARFDFRRLFTRSGMAIGSPARYPQISADLDHRLDRNADAPDIVLDANLRSKWLGVFLDFRQHLADFGFRR